MFQHFNPYSQHNHSVQHPGSPYEGEIPNGLQPGKQIHISGHIPHHAHRFQFDLKTHNGTALCINPRFDANSVVRNSEQHGSWANEELGTNMGPNPFQRGANFDLAITVEHDKFHVTLNGQHVFDFRHRVGIHDIHRLAIAGDVTVSQINYSGGAGAMNHEQHNVNVPGAVAIRNGMQQGRMIQIQGSVPHHANRFMINLQSTGDNEPNNMALVFNPRWNDPNSGGAPVVVRCDRQHGSWGGEERDGHCPFAKGANFDMLILCEHNEFKVAVNGQHFISFRHRSNVNEVNHVGFSGDVQIRSVKIF